MLFNRVKLIEMIRAALDAQEADHKAAYEKEQRDAAVYREKWIEKYNVQWNTVALEIQSRVRNGEPITSDIVPMDNTGYGTRHAFFSPMSTKKTPDWEPPRDVTALLAILESSTDAAVSTSALKDHGVANLRHLVANLGAAVQR